MDMHMAETYAEGAVCIPNISPPERKKRLIGGVIQSAVALGVLSIMLARGIDRRWRLALFPVWFGAATGYFQWRDKT
jgi:hypothetical protein